MKNNKEELRSYVITGFSTLVAREFFLKLFSFFGQVILARIFAPAEFGVYVIIVFVVGLFGLFSDIGLSLAIIQKKSQPTRKELSGIFWLKIFLAVFLMILIWILSPLIAFFYPTFGSEQITMLRVFSFTLLLTNLRTIPIALLERQIKYSLISFIDVMGVIIYYVVVLISSLFQIGVWSFIYGAVVKEIIETFILNFLRPYIPQMTFSFKNLTKMLQFGFYIQANNLVSFFISSLAPAIGGKLSGPYGVGLLDFSYSIVQIPNVISMNFARVAFAGYSRIQGKKELLSKSINKSVSLLAILLYIFPVIFIGFGGELINYIYSSKWLAALPALYWFSLAVFFYPTLTALGQVILSIGKSHEIFWISFVSAFVGALFAVILVLRFGFVGIAMANVIIYVGLYIGYIFILKRDKYKFSSIKIILRQFFIAIATILFAIFLNQTLPVTFIIFCCKLLLAGILYVGLMYIFIKHDTRELLGYITAMFLKKK